MAVQLLQLFRPIRLLQLLRPIRLLQLFRPIRLLQLFRPIRLLQLFRPVRLLQLFRPVRLLQLFRPVRLLQLFRPIRLLQLFRPIRLLQLFRPIRRKAKIFVCIVRSVEFLLPWENPGHLASRNDFCGTPGLSWGKRGRNGVPYIRVCCPLGRGAVQFGRCVPTFRANR